MKKITIAALSCVLFVQLCICENAFAVVCRNPYIQGLEHRIDAVHALLGEDTTDISKMKIFISKDGDKTFIQSNYRSESPDNPGTYSPYATKIRDDIPDIRNALANIIFWGDLPPDGFAAIKKALETAEILIDRKILDNNGRINFDLDGAKKIRLVTDTQSLASGEISIVRLKEPPPALVETIDGCCFKGRPPGRASAIIANLNRHKIDSSKVTLLPFVVDSGTDSVIAKSQVLTAARSRANFSRRDPWSDQLRSALEASDGGSLVMLTHINGKNVEVLDPAKNVLFSMPVGELRTMAREANVNLILFGCDTVNFLDNAGANFGIIGKYNTATAAARLRDALPVSTNMAELLKAIASPDIELVAYEEAGGNGYAGASAFAKVRGTGFHARIFRILSILGRKQ